MNNTIPWQLRMFKKTLKKKMRLKHLRRHIGSLSEDSECFLVTCGDNNGAMNYYLREMGGKWTWADVEEKSIKEMELLLGDKVLFLSEKKIPFSDRAFDLVVSIDVHEHLNDPQAFTEEMVRVAKDSGRLLITVPNGDETKLATRVKNAVGMTKEMYGHVREGYDIPELKEIMQDNQIEPLAESSFSKFFTEILELNLNFFYTKLLSKKSKGKVETGTIAPATKAQLNSVKKSYKLYSLLYPFFWIFSKLDSLLFFTRGHAVMVLGRKKTS